MGSWGTFPMESWTAFPARPALPTILSTARHNPGSETGIRGAVSNCKELGRHGRGRALQQCPGLLQARQYSPLPRLSWRSWDRRRAGSADPTLQEFNLFNIFPRKEENK